MDSAQFKIKPGFIRNNQLSIWFQHHLFSWIYFTVNKNYLRHASHNMQKEKNGSLFVNTHHWLLLHWLLTVLWTVQRSRKKTKHQNWYQRRSNPHIDPNWNQTFQKSKDSFPQKDICDIWAQTSETVKVKSTWPDTSTGVCVFTPSQRHTYSLEAAWREKSCAWGSGRKPLSLHSERPTSGLEWRVCGLEDGGSSLD